jgi:hypothetical protein
VSKPSPLTALGLVASALAVAFVVLWLVGVERVALGGRSVATTAVAGVALAVGLAASALVRYRTGEPRSAAVFALWTVGIPLVVADVGAATTAVGTLAMAASLAVQFEVDERVRTRAG